MNKIIFNKIALHTLVAISEQEKITGLMGKEWPPPIMSFPNIDRQISKFWMKNTPSPLDIIFCNAGKVIAIEKGIPNSKEIVGPDSPSDLVVELPFGLAAKLEIKPGASVRLEYDILTLAKKIELVLAKS